MFETSRSYDEEDKWILAVLGGSLGHFSFRGKKLYSFSPKFQEGRPFQGLQLCMRDVVVVVGGVLYVIALSANNGNVLFNHHYSRHEPFEEYWKDCVYNFMLCHLKRLLCHTVASLPA